MFRAIRRNPGVNKLISYTIKNCHRSLNNTLSFLERKTRTSGRIECTFNGLPFKMVNNCDDNLVDYFFYGKKYQEERDLKLFMTLAKSAECILDIGANTGLFSILSSKANPQSEIYSFEPYFINASRLKANIEVNEIRNINVIQNAVGNKNGEIVISIPKNDSITDVSSANLQFSKKIYPELEWKGAKVPLTSIDEFRKSLNKKINLVKCDVETYEMEVFKGMTDVLKNDRPAVLFECFLDQQRTDFFNEILKNFNYSLYLVLEQGLVYCREGFSDRSYGLNYLISPNIADQTFISYTETDLALRILSKCSLNLETFKRPKR